MSLISIMIALGASAIVLTGVGTVVLNSQRSLRAAQITSSRLDLVSEVRMALRSGSAENCTNNVRAALTAAGVNPDFRDPAGLSPVPMSVGMYQVSGGTPTKAADVLVLGQVRPDGLRVLSSRLRSRARLGERKALLELEISLAKTGDVEGARNFEIKRLPIFALLDTNGRFVSCSVEGSAPQSTMCDLLGEGKYAPSPTTGKCVERFVRQCFSGTPTTASCPAGAQLADYNHACESSSRGAPWVRTTSYVSFSSGNSAANYHYYMWCRADPTNTQVQCDHLGGTPQTGELCMACCMVPNPAAD